MMIIISILNFFFIFGLLKSGFDYIDYLEQQEIKKNEEKQKELDDLAIKKACKRVGKFLNSDGSVNTEAARAYMKLKEKEQRRKLQTVSFEVVK